jgi:citrate lyase beta subunit
MIERSMLFVPASRPDMIAKAAASAADAVCIDLEDSVAFVDKVQARAEAVQAFRELDFGPRIRLFRVNALDTHFAYRDLVEVIEWAGSHLDEVMLPKASSREDVRFVDTMLTQIEAAQGFERTIGIEVQIESAAGFLNIREIASASARLRAIIFGPGDYAASMRMPASAIGEADEHDALYPGHRWHSVMHAVVAAGRANGLRCIDGPFAGFRNAEGFERSCRIARAMGFDGKQCIHPSQLTTSNGVFTPTAEEEAHAQRLVHACEGKGAATLDGKMIDVASLRMAQVVVEQCRAIRKKKA